MTVFPVELGTRLAAVGPEFALLRRFQAHDGPALSEI
jgi:hypothetical protein